MRSPASNILSEIFLQTLEDKQFDRIIKKTQYKIISPLCRRRHYHIRQHKDEQNENTR